MHGLPPLGRVQMELGMNLDQELMESHIQLSRERGLCGEMNCNAIRPMNRKCDGLNRGAPVHIHDNGTSRTGNRVGHEATELAAMVPGVVGPYRTAGMMNGNRSRNRCGANGDCVHHDHGEKQNQKYPASSLGVHGR